MYQSGCSRNHGCSIEVWHGHEVHQHAQAAGVGVGDECVELRQRAEDRVDRA